MGGRCRPPPTSAGVGGGAAQLAASARRGQPAEMTSTAPARAPRRAPSAWLCVALAASLAASGSAMGGDGDGGGGMTWCERVCPAPAPCPVPLPRPPPAAGRMCPPCPTQEPTTQPPLPPGGRPARYRFHPERVPWLVANSTCAAEGGHLAVPRSQAELHAVLRILRQERADAFVGFHDFGDEGNYRTVLGQPMSAFQRSLWAHGSPFGGTHWNGVLLSTDGRLRDHVGFRQREFLCEYPLA